MEAGRGPGRNPAAGLGTEGCKEGAVWSPARAAQRAMHGMVRAGAPVGVCTSCLSTSQSLKWSLGWLCLRWLVAECPRRQVWQGRAGPEAKQEWAHRAWPRLDPWEHSQVAARPHSSAASGLAVPRAGGALETPPQVRS